MKKRIAINGFGRIGRMTSRLLINHPEIELVAINDLADINSMMHLFKYDSVHGQFSAQVQSLKDKLLIDGTPVHYFSEKDPSNLDWKTLNIDIVIEATGIFRSKKLAAKHIQAGAKKVIISAPPIDDDIKTIVLGVNDSILKKDDIIVSNASCTTNSAAHLIELLNELCDIESCYITTVHSYTGDQRLHDAPHKDLRRGRAAAESIVPTTTGAAKALTRIFPELVSKIGGCGIRVPVPDGSLTDITCIVNNPCSIDVINDAFRKSSYGKYKGILEYTEDPIVSRDIIGNPHSCIFDSSLTSVIGKMVKVVAWYDNEIGYSNRLVDLILKM